MSNSVPPHLIATAIDCNLGIWGISYTVTNFIHVRSCYYLKTLNHFTDLNMGEHTQELFFNMKKCTPGCLPLNSSRNYPIIISWNSSKSMVPDPSSSTSSTMWSRSSSVKVLSISLKMSFSTSFVMNPWHWKKRTLRHLFCQFLPPPPDEPTDLFVVNPESLLQFLLHLFLIVLYHELCCNLRGWNIFVILWRIISIAVKALLPGMQLFHVLLGLLEVR